MPEIGSTLREARMRARIDITEVEQATKIRAKYLRAIENEEWALLPGSTFVKSFIREYAAYLGMDGRSLVEEYKLRYEHPSENEMRSISPGLGRDVRSGRGGGRPGVPRWAITVVLLAVLLAALWAVGTLGGGSGSDSGGAAQTTPQAHRPQPGGADRRAQPRQDRQQQEQQQTAVRTQAGLRIVPTGQVYVCLVDQDDRVLIPGTIYAAGQRVPLMHGRSLRITLGNGNAQLRANGRPVTVTPSTQAIGFEVTPTRVRPISGTALPTCA